jgi:hypothetical protein
MYNPISAKIDNYTLMCVAFVIWFIIMAWVWKKKYSCAVRGLIGLGAAVVAYIGGLVVLWLLYTFYR